MKVFDREEEFAIELSEKEMGRLLIALELAVDLCRINLNGSYDQLSEERRIFWREVIDTMEIMRDGCKEAFSGGLDI